MQYSEMNYALPPQPCPIDNHNDVRNEDEMGASEGTIMSRRQIGNPR